MVNATRIPADSEIGKYLAGADLFDAFEVPIAGSNRSALQIYIDLMAKTPVWINGLMIVRDRAVAMFGLKHLGHLDDIDPVKGVDSYREGDRVGIFSILSISDCEVVFVEADKHLDAKVSLRKTFDGHKYAVVFSTVIHFRNILGRAYMMFVWPLHKLIVPSLLARSTNSGQAVAAKSAS
jgi:hypothetical protein